MSWCLGALAQGALRGQLERLEDGALLRRQLRTRAGPALFVVVEAAVRAPPFAAASKARTVSRRARPTHTASFSPLPAVEQRASIQRFRRRAAEKRPGGPAPAPQHGSA